MTYDIPAHRAGDTWKGIPNITIFRNGSALNLTNAKAQMKVRYQIDAPTVIEFNSNDNSIVFVAPTSGILGIPAKVIDVPPAKYVYDLEITLASGEIKTFMEGKWTILSQVSRS